MDGEKKCQFLLGFFFTSKPRPRLWYPTQKSTMKCVIIELPQVLLTAMKDIKKGRKEVRAPTVSDIWNGPGARSSSSIEPPPLTPVERVHEEEGRENGK